MIRVPKKMTAARLVMKFPDLHANRWFCTVLNRPTVDPVIRHLHAFHTLTPHVTEHIH